MPTVAIGDYREKYSRAEGGEVRGRRKMLMYELHGSCFFVDIIREIQTKGMCLVTSKSSW
jgi:hypothetical protein